MKLDNIHLRNIRLPLRLAIGSDAWHRNDKPQPAVISLRIGYPSALVDRAARNDTVGPTLDYGKLYRQIEADVGKTFSDEEGEYAPAARTVVKLASDISTTASELVWQTFADTDPLPRDELPLALWHEHKEIVVWIHLPKAILRADQGLKYRYRLDGMSLQSHKVTIEGIRCYCIIGINPHERREKQAVELGLEWSDRNGDDAGLTRMLACYQKLTQTVAEVRSLLSPLPNIAHLYATSLSITRYSIPPTDAQTLVSRLSIRRRSKPSKLSRPSLRESQLWIST